MKIHEIPALSITFPPFSPCLSPIYSYPVGLLGDAVAVAALADPGRAQGGLKPEAHQEGEDAESEPVERNYGKVHLNAPWGHCNIYIYVNIYIHTYIYIYNYYHPAIHHNPNAPHVGHHILKTMETQVMLFHDS